MIDNHRISLVLITRSDKKIKVPIPFSNDAALALRKLSDQEKRDPKQQTSLIIEKELIRFELIQPNKGSQV